MHFQQSNTRISNIIHEQELKKENKFVINVFFGEIDGIIFLTLMRIPRHTKIKTRNNKRYRIPSSYLFIFK